MGHESVSVNKYTGRHNEPLVYGLITGDSALLHYVKERKSVLEKEAENNGVSNKIVRATFWKRSVDVEESQPTIDEEDEFQSLYMGSSDQPESMKALLCYII